MMKTVFLFLALSFSSMVNAQTGDVEDVYSSDYLDAKFQGGDVLQFHKFVKEHFDMSKAHKGKMVASFDITETGELSNIRIIETVDMTATQEFIRVLKLSPKWQPAKKRRKGHKCEY